MHFLKNIEIEEIFYKKYKLAQPWTLEEIAGTIQSMRSGKAPGLDRHSVEWDNFPHTCWHLYCLSFKLNHVMSLYFFF